MMAIKQISPRLAPKPTEAIVKADSNPPSPVTASRMTETVERIRSEAAEQFRAELTRVAEEADRRREQDVAEMRATVEAEARATIEQDRQEAAEQHTAELARVREELEQQHADDLRRVQTTAVESFKALTGNLLGRV